VGATAYEVVGALVFLRGTAESVSPDWPMRLTVALAGSFFVATIAAFAAVSPSRRKPRATPEVGT